MDTYLRTGKRLKVEDNLTMLVIFQNPQTKDPKKLFRELQAQITKLRGVDNSPLDREGLQRLKQTMKVDNEHLRKTK